MANVRGAPLLSQRARQVNFDPESGKRLPGEEKVCCLVSQITDKLRRNR